VIAFSAVLDEEYTIDGRPAHAPGSPIEPRLLVTFTIRPAADFRSSGRNALVTRTTANTFVS
jgi:hypothetical protein